jgi:hypothetical protein
LTIQEQNILNLRCAWTSRLLIGGGMIALFYPSVVSSFRRFIDTKLVRKSRRQAWLFQPEPRLSTTWYIRDCTVQLLSRQNRSFNFPFTQTTFHHFHRFCGWTTLWATWVIATIVTSWTQILELKRKPDCFPALFQSINGSSFQCSRLTDSWLLTAEFRTKRTFSPTSPPQMVFVDRNFIE